MNCPKCNKIMIRRYEGMVFLTYPVQRPWSWWCGECNFYQEGGIETDKTIDEIALDIWREAQEEIKP